MFLDNFIRTAASIIDNPSIAANAQIIFEQLTEGSDSVEDEVGNWISENGSEEITLECYLVQTKPPVADVQAGINLDSEYFKGRLVDPKTYSFPIKAIGNIKAIINSREGLMTQLILLESPTSQQHDIKSYLGQRIACYVQFSQGN